MNHDLSATTLHIMGIDHLKFTYRSQGRDFRLTDVHGNVVKRVRARVVLPPDVWRLRAIRSVQ